MFALFKTELFRNPAVLKEYGGHWISLNDLEIATCAWISWFNEERIFMANSAISRQVKSRRTTLNNLRPLRREKNNQMSLRETQAESLKRLFI
jgi:hypothetical protein